jgi:aerobic carbon-monoxide dehydrogenase medium subunit
VLPRSARWIGHYPIRSRGTFGGSIAHADPSSEWCLLAMLLGARIILTGPSGSRTVPAAEFFEGYYSTAAGPDEMITEVRFPEPAPQAVLTEFAQRQGDLAIVAAAVSATASTGASATPCPRNVSWTHIETTRSDYHCSCRRPIRRESHCARQ